MRKVKIGIIGCGAIGSEIAKAIDRRFKNRARLIAISDIDAKKTQFLRRELKKKPDILTVDGLIKKSDLIIEAASAKISKQVAKKSILAKKDIMIMSAGGLLKDYKSFFNLAERMGCKIYLPSGAICGLDGLKAASFGKIRKVELVTRKPPFALLGAPFIKRNNINLKKIKSEKIIFSGNAKDAIKGFPANINVSCALSMAGIGAKKTRVKIITSPKFKRNIHEVVVEGDFGKLITKTENVPSPRNPKTSYLAILSAIQTLKQILEPIRIGT
ncbi:MAG: aspartate dehydrogenase [Candidatus Omnitrophica bacterium]|nr:aspartate dehydrogenase [Candidatus Omnitrophota bacterium]